jgi:hypothetical protein
LLAVVGGDVRGEAEVADVGDEAAGVIALVAGDGVNCPGIVGGS